MKTVKTIIAVLMIALTATAAATQDMPDFRIARVTAGDVGKTLDAMHGMAKHWMTVGAPSKAR